MDFFNILQNMKDYYYLFCVDPCKLNYDTSYSTCSKSEPKYGPAWLKGYIIAYKANLDSGLTAELFTKIHEAAMSWNQVDPNKGKYKSDYNNFSCYPMNLEMNGKLILNPTYSVTKDGYEEFVNYAIVNKEHLKNSFVFVSDIENNTAFVVESYMKGKGLFKCQEVLGEKTKEKEITREVLDSKLSTIWEDNVQRIEYSPLAGYRKEDIYETVSQEMQSIVSEFNNNMKKNKARVKRYEL